MAASNIGGSTGGVSMPSAHFVNASSWRLRFNHPVDDGSGYGDSGIGAVKNGSGTVDYFVTVVGVAQDGAASTAPGFYSIAAGGAAATLKANGTNTTYAGTLILTDGDISHAKRSGVTPLNFNGVFTGAVTETWKTT